MFRTDLMKWRDKPNPLVYNVSRCNRITAQVVEVQSCVPNERRSGT